MRPKPSYVVKIIFITICLIVGAPVAWSGKARVVGEGVNAVLNLFGKNTQEYIIEGIRRGKDVQIGSDVDRRLKTIAEEYGAPWREDTILTSKEIGEAWQRHVLPRLKDKWTINQEKPSRHQQVTLNGICLRAHIREMEPEDLPDKLFSLGLEQAGVGWVQVRHGEYN